jgi:hemolysin activation/secretion protein
VAGLALGLALLAADVRAQIRVEQRRPVERGREERELLERRIGPAPPPEEPILPPAPLPPAGTARPLAGVPQIEARGFRFRGNTVVPTEELEQVAAPYRGRFLTAEDLARLRDDLTAHYVRAGFVTSGAVLPEQEVRDGLVEVELVEGRMTEIELEGLRHFRPGYLRARLDPGADRPLQVGDLEERLQLLLQDDRIRSLDARLGPAERRGEARLHVTVDEAPPFSASLESSNHEPPSIGAAGGRFYLAYLNVTGWGDVLAGSYGITEGLDDFELDYALPVTARDTRLEVGYEHSASDVVESPFDELEIESRSSTWSVYVTHPLLRSRTQELRLGLGGEWRESRTYLLGHRFSFSPGSDDGKSRVAVLRFYQDWLRRDASQVLAARSTLSLGVDAFGATVRGGNTEDGQFLAWLAQLQWARRFDRLLGLEAVFRTDLQLASSALLSLEQFSLGGATSVRGYRENEIVRDGGFVSSLELRLPLWRAGDGRPVVQLAPFVDGGRAWSEDRPNPKPRGLASVGVGLRVAPIPRLYGELYWGHQLRKVDEPDDTLQDHGIHFLVSLDVL